MASLSDLYVIAAPLDHPEGIANLAFVFFSH